MLALRTTFILTAFAYFVEANEYCYMRSLCPQGEHLGCSYNENSWRSIPRGPIPLKRSSDTSIDERQQILDLHNQFRRSLAKGENDSQTPPRMISNMRELQWSDQLAYLARVRVALFQVRSGSDCADLPQYQVGMNQYAQSSPIAPDNNSPWEGVTKYWNSFSKFVAHGIMSDLKSFRDLAQFSQMLWPTTYEIGCASNNFITPGGYMRHVICLYGPVARCYDDTNPYTFGEPASNCIAGTVPNDGLCGFSAPTATPKPITDEQISSDNTTTATTVVVPNDITTPTTTTMIVPDEDTTTPPSTTTTIVTDDCEVLGTCPTPPTDPTSSTTTTTTTIVSECEPLDDCQTITATEPESTDPSSSSSSTSPSTTTTTELITTSDPDITPTVDPETPSTLSNTTDSTITYESPTPEIDTTTTSLQEADTTTTTFLQATDTTTLSPITVTVQPVNNATNVPCNGSSTDSPVPVNPDSMDILMKVFRYICELLSISPSIASENLVNVTHMLL